MRRSARSKDGSGFGDLSRQVDDQIRKGVMFENELLAIDLEAAEIVLVVRIVVRSEIVERSRELNRPSPDIIRQGANGCSHHDASAGQRFAKVIVKSTDFSALGALDCLVLIGFDLGIAGGTAVVAEAVPFIPPICTAGTGVVLPKPWQALVSSSFRSVREGLGDFGIAFLPGGDRFGELGR